MSIEKEPWEDDPPRRGIPLPIIKLVIGIVGIVGIANFIRHDGNAHNLLFGVGISVVVFMAERLAIKLGLKANIPFLSSQKFLTALPVLVMGIAVASAIATYITTENGVTTFGTLIFPTILTLLNWALSSPPE